jgi:acetyl-CoA carboxylase biotin carboxyl carrier protein
MEFENIKELIKLFDKSSLSKLKVHKDEFSIDLEKAMGEVLVTQVARPAASAQVAVPQVEAAPVVVATPAQKGEIVTSPMVGTFFKAPSPDSAAYAKVGEVIKKGKTMSIIEAMKIMNEIEAEFDCRILEILVEDGQPVEYDMPLFRVEKI